MQNSIFSNHKDMVRALIKPAEHIAAEIDADKANLIHMVLGISGESGELLDAIKKHAIYNKTLDINNVIEELGDLEFYLEGLRQALNISREDTISANIKKLSVRYSEATYSDKAAQDRRDKEYE